MVTILAYPKPLVKKTKDVVLTFVVPAKYGCGLNCKYCYIKQRKELSGIQSLLTPQDYADFISGVAEEQDIGCISLQGEEPLLPDSLPYTESILSISEKLNIPAAIVTNGVHLSETIYVLAKYRNIEELTVSIDSSVSKIHDNLRGKKGTFNRALGGLKKILLNESLCKVVSVASVLYPNGVEQLKGMPILLQELAVKLWFVTPAIKIGTMQLGGPISRWIDLMKDLQTLSFISETNNIEMIVEDEYNFFGEYRYELPPSVPIRFRNLDHPEGVLRLLPDGSCEVGHDLLRIFNKDAPRWIPGTQHPHSFYTMIMDKVHKSSVLI